MYAAQNETLWRYMYAAPNETLWAMCTPYYRMSQHDIYMHDSTSQLLHACQVCMCPVVKTQIGVLLRGHFTVH